MVGVIDSGVDNTHPDLAANVSTTLGYNFIYPGQYPMDDDSHGTHVAGTIGAVGNNNTGVAGVNWDVTIVPYKTNGVHSYLIASLVLSNSVKIPVVNYSMGGYAYNPNVFDSIIGYSSWFFMSAGNATNNNNINTHYPSSYSCPNIIAVAASDNNDQLCWFSNYGASTVHIAAPGEYIWSTVPTWYNPSGYEPWQGTSMAAPHVAGVAALLMSHAPDIDAQTLRTAILNNADYIPSLSSKVSTSGRLNAYQAYMHIEYIIGYDANGGTDAPAPQYKRNGV